MKRNYYALFLGFIINFSAMAQISCSADFNFFPSSDNNQKIIFQNASTVTGATPGVHHVYYEYRWGNTSGGVGAGLYGGIGVPINDLHHDYGTTGTWTAKLTIEVREMATNNVVCTSLITKTVTITGSNKCQADFTYTTPSPASTAVNFQNTSTATVSTPHTTHYEWDFDDGNTSNSVSPSHTYANRGHYLVNLKVYHVENSTSDTLLYHSRTLPVNAGVVDTCHAAFAASPDISNHQQIHFTNLSYYEVSQYQYGMVSYSWDFGDGASSIATNPAHTYAQDGNYLVQLGITTIDSLTNDTLCHSVYSQVVNVSPGATPFCNAEYIVDSASSGNGNLYVINTSVPASNDPNYSTSYNWDFGDGGTSNQAFPVHTYQAPGAYGVCLTIVSQDSSGVYCSDTYCDTLGLDSLGNLLKKGVGFTLNVLDPNSVGEKEHETVHLQIFPNPAADQLNIAGLRDGAEWYLYDINGRVVAEGYLKPGNNGLVLPEVAEGLYIFSIRSKSIQENIKLQIKR